VLPLNQGKMISHLDGNIFNAVTLFK